MWRVVFYQSGTGKVTEVRRGLSEVEAVTVAADFNRFQQDRTWNRVEAVGERDVGECVAGGRRW